MIAIGPAGFGQAPRETSPAPAYFKVGDVWHSPRGIPHRVTAVERTARLDRKGPIAHLVNEVTQRTRALHWEDVEKNPRQPWTLVSRPPR